MFWFHIRYVAYVLWTMGHRIHCTHDHNHCGCAMKFWSCECFAKQLFKSSSSTVKLTSCPDLWISWTPNTIVWLSEEPTCYHSNENYYLSDSFKYDCGIFDRPKIYNKILLRSSKPKRSSKHLPAFYLFLNIKHKMKM